MKKFFAYLFTVITAVFAIVFCFSGIYSMVHGMTEIYNGFSIVFPGIGKEFICIFLGILLLIFAIVLSTLVGKMKYEIDTKNKKNSW